MSNVRIPFFKTINLLDEIFPSTNELDYTKLTIEQLIDRFNTVVKEFGLPYEEERLQNVRIIIREKQRFLYKRQSNFVGNSKNKGFDQNNFFIKNCVAEMKNRALGALNGSPNWIYMVDADGYYRTDYFGPLELLEESVTKEKIMDYVRDLLSLTCAQNDNLDSPGLFDTSVIVKNIFYHFGLRANTNYSETKTFKRVEEFINSLISDTTIGIGKVYKGNSDNNYQQYSERYITNVDRFNAKFEVVVRQIVEEIWTIAGPALERTREAQRKIEEAKNKNEVKIKNPPKKPTPPKRKPSKPKQEQVKTEPAKKESDEVSLESLEALMRNYERMRELMAQNVEYAKELKVLNEQIDELTKQLDSLVKRKNEVEKAINNNKAALKKGLV